MIGETLRHFSASTPRRYIGSPITGGNTPARCGRVQQDQVILGNLLGTGGFGSVYMASIRGRTVAVKMYHRRCGNDKALSQSYNNELLAYRTGLKHDNVVSILGATSLHDFVDGAWIVMQYVGPHSLQTILNDQRHDLDRYTRLSLALQIARGLQYLHSISIVHLDLKPANCLVTHDLRLRIADFGCCHQLVPGISHEVGEEGLSPRGRRGWSSNQLVGTLAYRAPELLKGLRPSEGSDIYSLGITLWQMCTRRGPYEGMPAHAVAYQVVAKDRRPRLPSDNDDPFEIIFRDLYTQCWARSALDRPTSLDLVCAMGLWLDHM